MNIIIDAMSGDKAPDEILKGAFLALDQYGHNITLVGNSEIINRFSSENGLDISRREISVVNASDIITMEDDPFSIKNKKDSSMTVALKLLADGKGDALVSAGNTGALYTGGVIYTSRIKSLRKAALATFLPFEAPLLLIDAGANVEVNEEILVQFAVMGSVYVNRMLGIENPRVGLLNNGTEKTKGTDVLRSAHKHLSKNQRINFIGNVEAKTLPYGICDVLVTDGFSGNIILKLTEGLCGFMLKKLKGVYTKNPVTKLSSVIIRPELKEMKKAFDASEYGGAPLLGVSKPIIKAHGSSDAQAVKNAVRVAAQYFESGIISEIARLT